jgi:dCTP diphosphatase
MGTDSSTTIGELRELVDDFVQERSWGRFHSPKNLAMSIAIEAAEIMELFQWGPGDNSEVSGPLDGSAELADELADVLIYCLAMANRAGIDLSGAVRAKMARNMGRYPIGSGPG